MANEYLNNRTFESIIQSFQYHKRQKARYEMIIRDLQQSHARRIAKYQDELKKAALSQSQAQYQEVCDNYKAYQEELANAFYLLSANIANYAKYLFNGIEMDDAVQEGVMICFEKIDRFDPRKGKAFNYMTTCILNHYRQLYRSVRNYNELKKRYAVFLQDRFETMVFRNGKEKSQLRSSID